MPEFRLHEIAEAIHGSVENGNEDYMFNHFHFDTRLITQANTLFFAFKTPEGDGHRFVKQMENEPGAGAVVSREYDASGLTIPLIRVEDPLKAAHQLARYVRQRFKHIKYIGVTGSAGKTTTKEFIYQILSYKYSAYRSFKNWNNWIGMTFSLLNMSGEEHAAVFELAMSYPGIGEIDLLADILRPDVAVILNVFPVHLEFLKTVDNAAIAKSEILNHLDADGAAFINADSIPLMQRLANPNAPKGRKIYFGQEITNPLTHITLKEILRDKEETFLKIDFFGIETTFKTSLINRTQLENLFVAILVCQHLGMKHYEIQEALKEITPLSGRGSIYTFKNHTIIDETYNSNPEALKRTMAWVDQEYSSNKIAIVGDMLELGAEEARFHQEVGHFYAGLHFQRLITVGQRAQYMAAGAMEKGVPTHAIHQFSSAQEAGKFLKETIATPSVLLFKGSRGIQLEKAIEEFKHE